MSNQWFRFYSEVLNDPKVQSLDGDTFKVWVNLLCVTSQCDGHINFDDISFHLRMGDAEALAYCVKLADKGLLIPTEQGYTPKGWDNRQYKTDTSAERTRKYREKKKLENCDVTVTSPVTAPEQIQNRIEDSLRSSSPPAVPKAAAKQKSNLSRLSIEVLPSEWDEWAHAAMGWDVSVTADVWVAFRDYWQAKTGKSATKSDWFATWRNWCRNERPKGNGHDQRISNRNQRPHDVMGSAWASAAAELARPGGN
jgi:hypothetical protein